MKVKIENILGTKKSPNEKWSDVIYRHTKEGRMDLKSVINLIGVILDMLDRDIEK